MQHAGTDDQRNPVSAKQAMHPAISPSPITSRPPPRSGHERQAEDRQVRDGEPALQHQQNAQPDRDRRSLVLLDLTMPVLIGREALDRLREQAPHLPVLLTSGYESQSVDALGDDPETGLSELLAAFAEALFVGPRTRRR